MDTKTEPYTEEEQAEQKTGRGGGEEGWRKHWRMPDGEGDGRGKEGGKRQRHQDPSLPSCSSGWAIEGKQRGSPCCHREGKAANSQTGLG